MPNLGRRGDSCQVIEKAWFDAFREGWLVAGANLYAIPEVKAPEHLLFSFDGSGTFIEGIRALKASEGVNDYDVNTMATRQEMRGFVCGQCHVEYASGRHFCHQ